MIIIQLTAIIIILGLITGLFVHHSIKHDGKFYSDEDFIIAITGLLRSHEGVIIMLLLIMVGVFIA